MNVSEYKIIRQARKNKGYTLRELSTMIGVSISFLSDIEHGRRAIFPRRPKTRRLLYKVLGIKETPVPYDRIILKKDLVIPEGTKLYAVPSDSEVVAVTILVDKYNFLEYL